MVPLRWQALVQLVSVRFREFFREPEVIFWVYGFPIALALGLGFAFRNAAPEPPEIDVADTSDSGRAQEVVRRLNQAHEEDAKAEVKLRPLEECKRRLRTGKTALYVVAHATKIEYVLDPTRTDSVHARYWVEAVLSRDPNGEPGFTESPVIEPGARYIDFLLPGLMGTNIMAGGLFGVGFVLVDMRVRKLFKRLMATPMRHSDFLLSLLAARMIFLLPEMTTLLGAAWLLFGLPPPTVGTFFSVIVVIFISASAFAGIGLLLACRTEKTESISGLINALMMPMYIFSGVFFSSRRFPDEVQPIVQALPLTQVNDALREVMLEGASLWQIWWRLAILAAYATVCFALALRWFKWR